MRLIILLGVLTMSVCNAAVQIEMHDGVEASDIKPTTLLIDHLKCGQETYENVEVEVTWEGDQSGKSFKSNVCKSIEGIKLVVAPVPSTETIKDARPWISIKSTSEV